MVTNNNDCGLSGKFLNGKKVDDNTMNLPFDLADFSTNPLNHFLVSDEMFPLKSRLLRPCPGNLTDFKKVFNYWLSWSRRTIENIFGNHHIVGKYFALKSEREKSLKIQSCSESFT